MLPYVYTPAASFGNQDSMLALDKGWDETPPLSGKRLSVWSSYPTAYSHNYDAFDERADRSVSMCSNLQCPGAPDGSNLHACSRCHSTTYFSESCQVQDWHSFHASECSILARRYRERKANGSWCSFALRESYARFLDYMANYDISPPSEAREMEIEPAKDIDRGRRCHSPVVDCHPSDAIQTISSLPGGHWRCGKHFLRTYLASTWEHMGKWTRRIQQFVYDMQDDPNVVLVEAAVFSRSARAREV
ncbi:hypothetical protein FA13DRAFT_947208 [Coprinellus micaceus]|uniref:MYND-type domain-containing protein n=1 Tax=Coprinellus micaceus TaxID=71717 RepID=A0A4Y7SZX2_COPMI|nr:hypothetical protein FA13DRAFT_947208 [Coprinellus micaceus]